MRTTTPPKDFDLTANLFTAPGYVPAKANTAALIAVRSGYVPQELTPRLQKRGLLLIRGLLLASENTDKLAAKDYARKYGAMMLLGGAWHSFAEDRLGPSEEGFEGTRRRLKLFDFTRYAPGLRPTSEQMHTVAIEKLGDCIIAADDVTNAVVEGYSTDLMLARTRVGRLMGNTALHIAAINLGDSLAHNPHIPSLEAQVRSRKAAEDMKHEAVALSNHLASVPSPAAFADPMGSDLTTYLERRMPHPIADTMNEMDEAILAA